jgi:hypothetical protein
LQGGVRDGIALTFCVCGCVGGIAASSEPHSATSAVCTGHASSKSAESRSASREQHDWTRTRSQMTLVIVGKRETAKGSDASSASIKSSNRTDG